MIDPPVCLDCRYFCPDSYTPPDRSELIPQLLEGGCHRHSPVPSLMITNHEGHEYRQFSEWPTVMGDDWCGEFKTRECAQYQHAPSNKNTNDEVNVNE